MTDAKNQFTTWDYVVFAATLTLSAAIGVYFAFSGGKQKTTKEVLMANGNMSLLPAAMSLLASFMSAITFLGVTSEIYRYGTMYVWLFGGYCGAITIGAIFYIPVFYKLQVTSAFEYLQLRFNTSVRITAAVVYILQMTLYMSIVLYTPSLALSAVTGLNVWVAVSSVGVVCTIYTALGGIKAVMWTDTFQIAIMGAGLLAVVVQGCLTMGAGKIWQDGVESGRIDHFNWSKALNPDPLQRHTAFTLFLGGIVAWAANYGVNQTQVQRALSLPSLRKAQLAFFINIPGLLCIITTASFSGLILYSHYKDCDPVRAKRIAAPDQMYVLYVMEVMGHLPGLPGLIVSAIFSGSLSTLSSGYNSLAAVTLTDIVAPFYKMNDARAAMVAKCLAAGYGILAIAMSYGVSQIGAGVLQIALSTFGILGGPILGVFTVGMFYPWVNNIGALSGLICSTVFTLWIGVCGQIYKPPIFEYPTSVDGCMGNHSATYNSSFDNYTSIISVFSRTNTSTSPNEINGSQCGLGVLSSLSYMWMGAIAVITCSLVSILVSAFTGFNHGRDVDSRLISPIFDLMCCCLPKRFKRQHGCLIDRTSEKDESIFADNTAFKLDEDLSTEVNKFLVTSL